VHALTGPASLDLRFPGQWFQLETGLHYNWHRHYDPTTGRYTQPDPLGLTALLSDGPSVYAYAGQSPLMLVDPTGEFVPLIAAQIIRSALFGALLSGGLDLTFQLVLSGGDLSRVDLCQIGVAALVGALSQRAVFINARNARAVAQGLNFQSALLSRLGLQANTQRIGRSIPDAISGPRLIEAKNSAYVSNTGNLRQMLQTGRPVDLYVGSRTSVSKPTIEAVSASGGSTRVFNPATGNFSPYVR
jgi:RHS repeat-associated protein